MRIALNGCGRIGKNFVRIFLTRRSVCDLVAINIGAAAPETLVYALKYDSILGPLKESISYADGLLQIGDATIKILCEPDASKLPWKSLQIDWVVDVTGKYTTWEKAAHHVQAGAHRVLVSAPMADDDITIIMGVNEQDFKPEKHTIVSLGSCTTNAVVPLFHILQQRGPVQSAVLSTTHAYTNSQMLLDGVGATSDLRRLRAAGINISPSKTGASEVVQRLYPHLAGKLAGTALRVPVANVSIVEVVVPSPVAWSEEELFSLCEEMAKRVPHIVAVTREQLVSTDFLQDPHSVIIDLTLSSVRGSLTQIFGWYDNEFGYTQRIFDFLKMVLKR